MALDFGPYLFAQSLSMGRFLIKDKLLFFIPFQNTEEFIYQAILLDFGTYHIGELATSALTGLLTARFGQAPRL